MRFKTKYMCQLLNEARHAAFGLVAAKLVTEALHAKPLKVLCFTFELFWLYLF
jgi:hypothetical protein